MDKQVNQIPNEFGGYDYHCTECKKKLNSGDTAYTQSGDKQIICVDCWNAGKRLS